MWVRACARPCVTKRAMTAIAHQFIDLPNGIRLHVASAGEKSKRPTDANRPLMVCLHGFPEFWAAWEGVLPALGEDYFVVAPDLRGFNLSAMPPEVEKYRAKHLVEDIKLLIEALGYQTCVLVAHDWGGAVAWNFAVQHRAMVEKLVIINSPHPETFRRGLANDPVQQQASAYMNWLRAPGSEEKLAANDFAKMKQFLVGMGQAVAWFTPEVEAQYKACWTRGLTGGVNFYRASPLFPPTATEAGAKALTFPKEFVTVHVPTLVIWGMADSALPSSLVDGLNEFVPNMQLKRVEGATHWIIHEQPGLIIESIRAFTL
jgi:epoxide hydrolase 4